MPYIESSDDLKTTHSPDWDRYQRRREAIQSRGAGRTEPSALPSGFPSRAQSASVWSGGDIDFGKLTLRLSPAEIDEIEEALRLFKRMRLSPNDICCDTFRLPTLRTRLGSVSREVFKGKGIAAIRGLDPDRYSVEDNIIIQAGISSYVAPLRGNQSGANDQVFHICNREHMPIADLKSNSTANQLPFHTDDTDVLGFYAIETSMSGGEMLWASQGQVYNELAANRPEVLGVLAAGDWPLQTAAEPPDYIRLPLLYTDERGPFLWLARGNFTGTPRTPRARAIPDISPEQADALDAVHFAAAKHAIKVAPRKGEIYFVNNLSVFHSRNAFQDDNGDGPGCSRERERERERRRRRHILRLWLRHPEFGRAMAGPLRRRWDQVFDVETSRRGRWLLFRDMEPDVVSEKLFKGGFPIDTFSSCQNN